MSSILKICTVVGARPQFIKASVVSREIRKAYDAGSAGIEETIIHTGQHFDTTMSDVFFRELDIPEPEINLHINNQSHAAMTAEMLVALESEFIARDPGLVLVYGDTDSTLAAALAAAKLRLPLAHVESGPRTFNKDHPEEINRLIADHLADLKFCPTEHARRNLLREGIEESVYVVGDVMLDAVLHHIDQAPRTKIKDTYVIATIHRQQNTDSRTRLAALLEGLRDCPGSVVMPLHPRTRNAVDAYGLRPPPNVRVAEPFSYLEMLGALRDCKFVVSDSGGLPKEAYFLGKRSLIVSSDTPWPELVDAGAAKVVTCDRQKIRRGFEWAAEPLPKSAVNPFGNGDSGRKIVEILRTAAVRPS